MAMLFGTDKLLTPRLAGVCMLIVMIDQVGQAQPMREDYLQQDPIAKVAVQSLGTSQEPSYAEPNRPMMYQPEAEDPLSLYSRTLDGEWLIPSQSDASDRWIRVLLLTPVTPTIVDIAIDINERPFRAAREVWIDRLLASGESTSIVRAGVEAAESQQSDEEPVRKDSEAEEIREGATVASGAEESPATSNDAGTELADEEDAVPMVKARSRATNTLFERLVNYLAADQATADREEVRWLLAEWTGGPAQLLLGPALTWRRADVAPLWNALDLDGDRVLDQSEISKAESTLQAADINRDEIVDESELERMNTHSRSTEQAKGDPLAVVLDQHTEWHALEGYLRRAYTGEQGQTLNDWLDTAHQVADSADLASILQLPADIVYFVNFASEDAQLRVLALNGSAAAQWEYLSDAGDVVSLECPGVRLELSAAQGDIDEENAGGDMKQTQVAIGVVVDGSPLLRLIDHDDNRQLTARERSEVPRMLATLDRNQDGDVMQAELPLPLRLAVTHGPYVHSHLAQPVAANRAHEEGEPADAPPWFASMDRNGDGDLSRREFQGNPAQFAQLDQDGDGLISRSEVLDIAAKN